MSAPIDDVRFAVFHAGPRDAVELIERLSHEGLVDDDDDDADEWRWLYAVALGAVGRYRAAEGQLLQVGIDSPWASQALSTQGSHRRQRGDHRSARDLDDAALRLAMNEADTCDALVGLAADAVGLGDSPRAMALLAQAEGLAEDWRRATRCLWVRAEITLLTDRPEEGIGSAREAVDLSAAASAPRHRAKSQLIEGVCLLEARGHASARAPLERAHALAVAMGAWSLAWPAAHVLARVEQACGREARAAALAAQSAVIRSTIDAQWATSSGWH